MYIDVCDLQVALSVLAFKIIKKETKRNSKTQDCRHPNIFIIFSIIVF